MLSGAGLIKAASDSTNKIHFHQTTNAVAGFATGSTGTVEIDLTDALESSEKICPTAPIYVMELDTHGDITGKVTQGWAVDTTGKKLTFTNGDAAVAKTYTGAVMVDYYVIKNASTVSEMQIDAGNFAGYYYVEADTLFRRQSDGKDLPANITFPNVKIQSNFTFSMAATGDPSTFTFTMDAFPGYTYFDRTKKVLCAIQVVDDATEVTKVEKTIFPHPTGFNIDESIADSVNGTHDSDLYGGTETDDVNG
jgi:hypothetical protein